jgi:S1-C subfamily serine protease
MKRLFPLVLLTSVFVLVSLACQLATPVLPASRSNVPVPQAVVVTPPSSAAIPQQSPDLSYQDTVLTTLYEKVSPGIVSIQVLTDTGGGLGSGFVFDKQGNIVTNYHVVEGATDLEVDFPSGVKVRGKVVATDLDSDMAVVKVEVPQDALFPLEMGDSTQIKVGQSVVAIGNPFGLTGTMTLGIVSARGRTLDSIRTTAEGRSFGAGGLIQTDAAINPGNSGGPLLDLQGRVIGINRAIAVDTSTPTTGQATNSGVGYAVPVNIVKRVIPVLIEKGSYDYPYLGISGQPELSLLDQEALGLSQSTGTYVVEVVPGGPADKAGLRGGTANTDISGLPGGGDLITAVDGVPVHVYGDLLQYLMENKSPGDTLVVTFLRDNKQQEVTVTLGKRP